MKAWSILLFIVSLGVGVARGQDPAAADPLPPTPSLSDTNSADSGTSSAILTNSVTGTPSLSAGDLPEKGLNHKHVRWIQRTTNDLGQIQDVTNVYVHLQPGLHFMDTNGQLVESKPVFEIKGRYAVADKMQFKVRIGGNARSSGYLEVSLPDGRKLRSHVGGLRYFDTASGEAVLIATVKDSQAYIVGDNQVIFPDAFTNVTCDIRYTVTPSGLEQDILVHPESPLPAPEEFGLPSATTRLEILSEFVNPPANTRQSATNTPSLWRDSGIGVAHTRLLAEDINVDFGTMQIGAGKAFQVGNGTNSLVIPVGKRWLRINSAGEIAADNEIAARQFLVEAVDMTEVAPIVSPDPSAPGGGGMLRKRNGKKIVAQAGHRAIPPLRGLVDETAAVRRDPPKSLLAALAGPLFVLDYDQTLSTWTGNNFVFRADQTYFVVGQNQLSGTTVFEGGAVIKMELWPQNSSPQHNLIIHGPIVCKTSAFLPTLFTARDDNTVGSTISTSTGSVTYGYGTVSIYLASDAPAADLQYLHFAYNTACINCRNGKANRLRHSQFFHCGHNVEADSNSSIYVGNVLMTLCNDLCAIGSGGSGVFEQVTCDRPVAIHPNYFPGGTFTLRNCLVITNSTTPGDLQDWQDGGGNKWVLSSTNGLFVECFGGNYYLPTSSPYRNAGVTGIDSGLAADLKKMTVDAPHSVASTITSDLILNPVVPLDTGTYPAVGYHYPPVDYACKVSVVQGAKVILTNGVSCIYAYGSAFALREGSSFISTGSPTLFNTIVHYRLAQEAVITGESSSTQLSVSQATTVHPVISLRYTEASAFGGGQRGGLVTAGQNSGQQNYIPISSFTARDCRFVNMWIYAADGTSDPVSYTFFNNLMRGGVLQFFRNTSANNQNTPMSVTVQNNTFHFLGTVNFGYEQSTVNPSWVVTDNVFDGTAANLWLSTTISPSPVTVSNNGFGGTNAVIGSQGNVNLGNGVYPTYATGPMGAWYSTTTAWLNAGSRAASAAGLYHYTIQTSQAQEGTSQVDLGFHYLATKSSTDATPADTDGDGIPDYVEDPAGTGWVPTLGGNGSGGGGTGGSGTAFNNPDSDYDGISDGAEIANRTDPLNANSFTPMQLASWTFNDPPSSSQDINHSWKGNIGQLPQSPLNISPITWWAPYAGSGPLEPPADYSVELGSAGNDPSNTKHLLAYKAHETGNYQLNLGLIQGTVRFWFRPNWTSERLGLLNNSKLSSEARLFTFGLKNSSTPGYWSIRVLPSANATAADTLQYEGQYPVSSSGSGFTTASCSVPITWKWGEWHQITLSYGTLINPKLNGVTTTSLVVRLYVDGELVGRVANASTPFNAATLFGANFAVGSDTDGSFPARGRIDKLETFNYPLDSSLIRSSFRGALVADSDSDGVPDIREDTFNTDPGKADTDGDGIGDRWETAYAVRQADGTYLTGSAGSGAPANFHGMSPLVSDANLDTDGDGHSNQSERDAGTFPLAIAKPIPVHFQFPARAPAAQNLVSVDFTPDVQKKTSGGAPTGPGAAYYSTGNGDKWNVFTGITGDPASSPQETSDPIIALRTGISLSDSAGNATRITMRVGRGFGLWLNTAPLADMQSCANMPDLEQAACIASSMRGTLISTPGWSDVLAALPCAQNHGWSLDVSFDPANSWWLPQMYWWTMAGDTVVSDYVDDLGKPYLQMKSFGGYNGVPMMMYSLDAGGTYTSSSAYDTSALPGNISDYLYSSVDADDCWGHLSVRTGSFWETANNTVIALSGLDDSEYMIYLAAVTPENASGNTPPRRVHAVTGEPSSKDWSRYSHYGYWWEGSEFYEPENLQGWNVFHVEPQQGKIRLILPAPAAINALQIVKITPPLPPPPPPGSSGAGSWSLTAEGQYKAIALSWDWMLGVAWYDIYRSSKGESGPYFKIDSVVNAGYVDTSLPPWDTTTYWYYVEARSWTDRLAVTDLASATPADRRFHDINMPPILNRAKPLAATLNTPIKISLPALLDATDAMDPEGDPLQVQISKIYAGAGTLQIIHGGSTSSATAPSMMVLGDYLLWTPPLDVERESVTAFDIRVSDGLSLSQGTVSIVIRVDPPTALLGWGWFGDGQLGNNSKQGSMKRLIGESMTAKSSIVLKKSANGGSDALLSPVQVANYGDGFNFARTLDGSLYGWGMIKFKTTDKGEHPVDYTSGVFDYPMGIQKHPSGSTKAYDGYFFNFAPEPPYNSGHYWVMPSAEPIYYAKQPGMSLVPMQGVRKIVNGAVYNAVHGVVAAVLDDGTLWMWGGIDVPASAQYQPPSEWDTDLAPSLPVWDANGQRYPNVLPAYPAQVPDLDGVADAAMDDNAILVLKNDGTLWWWGFVETVTGKIPETAPENPGTDINGSHTLPNDTGDQNSPNQLSFIDADGTPIKFQAIACGSGYYLGLDRGGSVWEWGIIYRNDIKTDGSFLGQVNDQYWNPVARKIEGLSGVTAISTSWGYSLALLQDGTVKSWGSLKPDNNVLSKSHSPAPIRGLPPITQISAGPQISLAVDSAKRVWAWGRNTYRQLGVGDTDFETANPQLMTGIDNASYVSSGAISSFAAASVVDDRPINLAAKGGDGRVELSWDLYPGAVKYNVKRYNPLAEGYDLIAVLQGADTVSYTDLAVQNGVSYRYVVSAETQSGAITKDSDPQAGFPMAPPRSAPQNLIITAACRGTHLVWDDSSTGAENYRIYRIAADGSKLDLGTVPKAQSRSKSGGTFDDQGLDEGTYQYVVAGSNQGGDGPPCPISAPITVDTTGCLPPPTGLSAAQINIGSTTTPTWAVLLNWVAPVLPSGPGGVDGSVVGYELQNFDKNAKQFTTLSDIIMKVDGVVVTTFQDNFADLHRKRTYRVAATVQWNTVDGDGNPALSYTYTQYSIPLTFEVTSPTAPVTINPNTILPSAGNGIVMLTWPDDENTDHYIVEASGDGGANWDTVSFELSSEKDDTAWGGMHYFWHRTPVPPATGAGPVNGTAYIYRIHGVNDHGAGDTTVCPLPATPLAANAMALAPSGAPYVVKLTAVAYNAKAQLDWSNNGAYDYPGTWQFFVQRRSPARDAATPAGLWEVASVLGGMYAFEDTDLVNGTDYEYKVVAFDEFGNRMESQSLQTGLGTQYSVVTPHISTVSFDATAGDGFATLSWPVTLGQVAGSFLNNDFVFVILRSTDSTSPGTPVATIWPGTDTTHLSPDGTHFVYQDTGLVNGTRYYYTFNADSGTDTLLASQPLGVTPMSGAAPLEPSVTAKFGPADGSAKIDWGRPRGAAGAQMQFVWGTSDMPSDQTFGSASGGVNTGSSSYIYTFTPPQSSSTAKVLWVRVRALRSLGAGASFNPESVPHSQWVYEHLNYGSWSPPAPPSAANPLVWLVNLPAQATAPTNIVLFASSKIADLARINFVVDGAFIGSSPGGDNHYGPFQCTWYNVTAGSHQVHAEAVDSSGTVTTSVDATVYITWATKLSDYTTGATDLQLPAPGMPISLSRSYSSAPSALSSDLGAGWIASWMIPHLEIGGSQSLLGSALSQGWKLGVNTPSGATPVAESDSAGDSHRVSVFLPNGQEVRFHAYCAVAVPASGAFMDTSLAFVAEDQVSGTLTCDYWANLPLYPDSDTADDTDQIGVGDPVRVLDSSNATDPTDKFNPLSRAFYYTAPDLSVWTFSAPMGGSTRWNLASVQDASGNHQDYTYFDSTSVDFGRLSSISTYSASATAPLRTVTFRYPDVPQTPAPPSYPLAGLPTQVYVYDSIESDPARPSTLVMPSVRYVMGGTPRTLQEVDRLVTRISAGGASAQYTITKYTYDASSGQLTDIKQMPSFANVANMAALAAYSPSGLLTLLHNTYQSGKLASQTDARGRVASLNIDSTSYTASVTQNVTQDGSTITAQSKVAYGPDGRPVQVMDPVQAASSNGKSTQIAYNEQGLPATVTAPDGGSTTTYYDALGRPASVTDDQGNSAVYQRDDLGNLLSTTDKNNNVSSAEYGAGSNVTRQTDAGGTVTDYEYNDVRFPTQPTRVTVNGPGLGVPVVTDSVYDDKGELQSQVCYLSTDLTGALAPKTRTDFSYDGNGNIQTQIQYRTKPGDTTPSAMGASGSTMDALGRPIASTDPLSRTSSSVYDALGRVTSSTDVYGRVTYMTYDAVGNLLQTVYPDNTLTRTFYDEANRPVFSQDRVAFGTYTLAQLTGTATTLISGPGTKTTYDAAGRSVASTRYSSAVVTLQLDTVAGNNLMMTTIGQYSAAGSKTRSAYDANGRVGFRFDALGNATGYTYDTLGRVTVESRYQIANTAYLDPNSTVDVSTLTHTQANPSVLVAPMVTTYGYDANGNRTWMVDANNQSAAGTDPLAPSHIQNRTDFVYDEMNRVIVTLSPWVSSDGGGNVSFVAGRKIRKTSYDGMGRKLTEIDENGVVTLFAYDPAGRLLSVTQDAFGSASSSYGAQVTQYAYDEIGNQLSVQDAQGQTTSYQYDDLGRRTKTILPGGGSETTAYQTAAVTGTSYSVQNNTVTALNGNTTILAYDVVDRLVARKPGTGWSGEVAVTFGYDAAGRRAWMEDASGHTTYTYDTDGRLTQKTTAAGTIKYGWLQNGLLSQMGTGPYGASLLGYAYDGVNRLTVVNNIFNFPLTSKYSYDNAGNLKSVVYPSGITHQFTYSEQYRLLSVSHAYYTTPLASFNYSLDPAGHRTQLTEQLPGATSATTKSYTYDSDSTGVGQVLPHLYRLTQELWDSGPEWKYRYDKAGNRLQRIAPLPTSGSQDYQSYQATYDGSDRQLTDTRSTGQLPVFDANGNQIRYSNNDVDGGIDGSAAGERAADDVYNFENQLKLATKADNSTIGLVYDGDGNRVVKTSSASGGQTTLYLVDDRNPSGYAQVLEEFTLPAAPINGMVGRWPFNEGAGTNVSDISGNGHHGVNLNSPAWLAAKSDTGLQFGSSSAQVLVPDQTGLRLSGALTVAFWMRMDAVPSTAVRVVGKGASDANQNYGVWIGSDRKVYFKFNNGSSLQSAQSSSTLSVGTWYHIAVTLNPHTGTGAVQFYINSVLDTSQTVSGLPVSNSDPLTIGYVSSSYSATFNGVVDEVSLYNRVLSSGEIGGLNNLSNTGTLCRYTLGTSLISQERRTTGGGTFVASYYGYDGLGSVRALYDSTGANTDTYTYDAFGTLASQTPATGRTVNNFRFAGQQWDPDLKLYYNRARYLNPDTGRFTSRDTFDGGAGDIANLHRYLYCDDNPMNGVDPSGHEFTFVGALTTLTTAEGLQGLKGGVETKVEWSIRDAFKQMANDYLPTDLNQKLGLEGEEVWVRYLNRIPGFRTMRAKGPVSAVGPDIYGVALKNGRIVVFIGEVKATEGRLPGVGKLEWNLINAERQMSASWLDRYASQIVDGMIDLGLQGLNEPQLRRLIKRGKVETYLLGALKEWTDWRIRGFRLMHLGDDEVLPDITEGGFPEITTEQVVH